jgi:IS4 transposase
MAAIKSIKKGLFWSHQYIFSNYFLDGWSAEKIFNFYNKRGCMENLIKELKQDFFYDKTDSSTFLANYARNLISCISYNIIKLFQNKVLNQKNNKEITSAKSWMFSSIRNNLLKIGTRVIKHGRYIHFKLTNSNPFDKLFWLIFHRILA